MPCFNRKTIERTLTSLSRKCRQEVEIAIDTGTEITSECRSELITHTNGGSSDGNVQHAAPSSGQQPSATSGKESDLWIFTGIGVFLFIILGMVFVSRKNKARRVKARARVVSPPKKQKQK